VDVDWHAIFEGVPHTHVDLPTYAFQRERYWLSAGRPAGDPAERGFWDAVERADVATLSAQLDVDALTLGAVLPALSSWRQRRHDDAVLDSWRYRVAWKPLGDTAPGDLAGTWLLIAAEEDWPDEMAAALAGNGARVLRLALPGTDRRAMADLISAVVGETALTAVVALPGSGRPDAVNPSVPVTVAWSVMLLQALGDAGVPAPVWWVTRGAADEPGLAAVWGLGPVVRMEMPDRWAGLVDLPADADDRTWDRFVRVLAGAEDEVAIRADGVYGRRLMRAAATARPVRSWSAAGRTVVVTGGTGALGAHVARWLAGSGAGNLLLLNRRGMDAPGAGELLRQIGETGCRASIVACDLADRDALREALAAIPPELPLGAVFHTAAVLDDALLDSLTLEQMQRVWQVKAQGALNLHELTADAGLSAFVLFSSFAGISADIGHGNYAPANAYLDGLARHRRAQGLPATSIAWGHWSGGGIADAVTEQRLSRRGMRSMPPERAVAALQQVLDRDETTIAVASIAWDALADSGLVDQLSPLLCDLPEVQQVRQAAQTQTTETGPQSEFRRQLARIPRQAWNDVLLDLVRTQVAAVLGHDGPHQVESVRAFRELGMDSISAVELRNRLKAATGLSLPATLVFDHPNPGALADHLCSELSGEQADVLAPATTSSDEPIAIVSVACRFPGGANSPDEFWALLRDGVDAMSGFPQDRDWDMQTLFDRDSAGAGVGGFVSGATEFDAPFFGISPREALAMDPQQRVLLETAWEVVERAGIDPASLKGSPTGVFAGTNGQDYAALALSADDDVADYLATGNTAAVMSGRVAYTFGFEGPAVTVDTACSSSLVAMHLAVQALRQGECTLALAGGVTVMSTLGAFVAFTRQQGLAVDGRCKAFAADADGTGFSEGVGLVLLERLSDARRNGHEVLAVLRGSAVN
ncbi:SDR family NAD(P)-dependent oxidoreductase, partial [Micromonospora arborensis]|uniref:SDR family NAD(P)-dependent oxidoreductase n=1 Tax=Micromonospora arborensis TaxID=2116518 RepID=UPI0033C3E34E